MLCSQQKNKTMSSLKLAITFVTHHKQNDIMINLKLIATMLASQKKN